MNKTAIKIILLQKAIDELVTSNLEALEQEELVKIDERIESTTQECIFFSERQDEKRVIYELTTLLNWIDYYISKLLEF